MIKNLSVFQAVFYGTLIVIAGIGLYVFATYTSTGGANEIGSVTIWGTLPSDQMRAALELYAEVFEAAGALKQLEAFASHFGADDTIYYYFQCYICSRFSLFTGEKFLARSSRWQCLEVCLFVGH